MSKLNTQESVIEFQKSRGLRAASTTQASPRQASTGGQTAIFTLQRVCVVCLSVNRILSVHIGECMSVSSCKCYSHMGIFTYMPDCVPICVLAKLTHVISHHIINM